MASAFDVEFEIDTEDMTEAASEAIAKGLSVAKRGFRNRIPPKRRVTREAVTSEHRGLSGDVGIIFPPGRRYQKQGTETKRIAEAAWKKVKHEALAAIAKSLSDTFKELDQ